MASLDLNKLTSEQEHVLGNAYRFIKQRAAWFRAQKKAAAKSLDSKTHSPATANTSKTALTQQQKPVDFAEK